MDQTVNETQNPAFSPGNTELVNMNVKPELIEINSDDNHEIINISSDDETHQPKLVEINSDGGISDPEIVEVPVKNQLEDVLISTQKSVIDDEVLFLGECRSENDSKMWDCYVDLHNGVNQYEISKCAKCVKLQTNAKTKLSDVKGVQCNLCRKFYSSKIRLKYHACAGRDDADHLKSDESCDECNGIFKDKGQQYQDKIHVCQKCGKGFNLNSDLNQHLQIHTKQAFKESEASNLESYFCNECGKMFKQKVYLKLHVRGHFGKKSHSCGDCGKCFKWKKNLNEHKKVHVSGIIFEEESRSVENVGADMHLCEKCGEFFVQKISLKSHLQNDTACDEEGKIFENVEFDLSDDKYGEMLFKDEKHPTDDKIYLCESCGNSFMLEMNLKRHLQRKLYENLFTCDEEGKSFNVNAELDVPDYSDEKSDDDSTEVSQDAYVQYDEGYHLCQICENSLKLTFLTDLQKFGDSGDEIFLCENCGNVSTAIMDSKDLIDYLQCDENLSDMNLKCHFQSKWYEESVLFKEKLHPELVDLGDPNLNDGSVEVSGDDEGFILQYDEGFHLCQICGNSLKLTFLKDLQKIRNSMDETCLCENCGNLLTVITDSTDLIEDNCNETLPDMENFADLNFPVYSGEEHIDHGNSSDQKTRSSYVEKSKRLIIPSQFDKSRNRIFLKRAVETTKVPKVHFMNRNLIRQPEPKPSVTIQKVKHSPVPATLRYKRSLFSCGDCGKKFAELNHLKMHKSSCEIRNQIVLISRPKNAQPSEFIMLKEPESLRFVCHDCGKTCKSENGLRRHFQLVHTADKPYVCDVCGKRYAAEFMLELHKVSHFRESLYVCQKCGCNFQVQNNFIKHLEEHEEKNNTVILAEDGKLYIYPSGIVSDNNPADC